MFGKKKEEVKGVDRAAALELINENFKDIEDVREPAFMEGYIGGLVEMAFALGAITLNERADYTTQAHTKAQEIKAKGQPVYKKKGVYEYRGYNILKGDGGNWNAQKIGATDMLVIGVSFKDAVKEIDAQC